jgi:hypothetical protein
MILYLAGFPYDCVGMRQTLWNANAGHLLFSFAHNGSENASIKQLFADMGDKDKMILYLAGSLGADKLERLANRAHATNFLETFAHKDAQECARSLANESHMRLFVDSGAFTAWSKGTKIDIDEYIKFCHEIKAKADASGVPVTFACLDVIAGKKGGDKPTQADVDAASEAGWANYEYMKSKGIQPLMVFHGREKKKWLTRMAEDSDYVGLSPMKVNTTTDQKISWLSWCFRHLEAMSLSSGKPLTKTHGFGISSPTLLEKFPFYTADSTAWLQAGRTGAYRFWTGRRAQFLPPAFWPLKFEWRGGEVGCTLSSIQTPTSPLPAIHRYRPPKFEGDGQDNVGIYWFAMRAMKADTRLECYLSRIERGVQWA